MILSFSRSKGLYGGFSLDGAVVAVRDSLNKAYFNGDPSPADILVRHTVRNPHSGMLAESVARAGNAKVAKSECASVAQAEKTASLTRRN